MKNQDNNLEQILLSNATIDDLIKKKIENEYIAAIEKAKAVKKVIRETDISRVPKELIFSNKSVFRVYNKKSQTETCINGIQAEALIGLQNTVREKIAKGEMASFAAGDMFVKFEHAEYFE